MAGDPPEPIYFASPAEWRAWLEEHHADADEVFVGFYKKHTGRQGLSWEQAVDEALCFGWIDTILRRVDDDRHYQRFTPRKARSNWSAVNIANVERLVDEEIRALLAAQLEALREWAQRLAPGAVRG